jgi:hypothetical protein
MKVSAIHTANKGSNPGYKMNSYKSIRIKDNPIEN